MHSSELQRVGINTQELPSRRLILEFTLRPSPTKLGELTAQEIALAPRPQVREPRPAPAPGRGYVSPDVGGRGHGTADTAVRGYGNADPASRGSGHGDAQTSRDVGDADARGRAEPTR